jgi:hypothetical protein
MSTAESGIEWDYEPRVLYPADEGKRFFRNVRRTFARLCVLRDGGGGSDDDDDDDRNVIKKEAEKILKYKTLQQKYSACGT